nr:phospholipid carrier-dependent glycosyltransferase [Corynebacterium phocae]
MSAIPAPRYYPWTRKDTISTLVIATLAFITRFAGLSFATSDGTPVFDEKHYVPQAFDMVRSWDNLLIGGIEFNPGFGLVVHPPLGKQIIALSEMVFGYTPLGWRVAGALLGVGVVLLTMQLARTISASWQVAAMAGFIAVFDGVLLVTSRFGMLDIFQTFFIVAAAYALARDHEQVRARLHAAWENRQLGRSPFGPRFGFRWWRFTAGVMLGMSLGVKWSGLYFIMFFGLMSVFSDLALRRRYGVRRHITGALIRDTPAALASLVALPVAIYVWTWRAWFASDTAVYRHAKVDGTIESGSALKLLPEAVSGWFYYHKSVLDFHASLTSSSGHSHPWDSKPWAWLVGARPVLYYSNTDLDCLLGSSCRQMIYLFGTPIIWWLIVPAVLWGLWSLVIGRDRRFLVPLVGFAAAFVPWLASFDRQMYFFYAVPFIPFVIVLIALALGQLSGTGKQISPAGLGNVIRGLAGGPVSRGTVLVTVYLAAVLAFFLVFSSNLYGYTVPDWWYESLMWMPSWR